MKRNDSVSLSWVRMLTPGSWPPGETYFTISQGVQISGRAVIVDPEDDRFEGDYDALYPHHGQGVHPGVQR